MKKIIFLFLCISNLGTVAFATNILSVETTDGNVDYYLLDEKSEVYFEEDESQGVTVSGKVGDYTYVDLGLGVKWATFNVGASQPEEEGSLFAWGETKPQKDSSYTWKSYEWYDEEFVEKYPEADIKYAMLKYYWTNILVKSGYHSLCPEDDAATKNWGNDWRMPSKAEAASLISNCTWSMQTINGHYGYLGVSKLNGNTIFFPKVSYYSGKEDISLYDSAYWTKDLGDANEEGAPIVFKYCCNLGDSVPNPDTEHYIIYRFEGLRVRAVLDKK